MSKVKRIEKRDNEFSVEIIDNGFVIRLNGRDGDDNWVNGKVYCHSEETLFEEISKFVELPEND